MKGLMAAQADAHVHSDMVKGKHAEFMVGGMQAGLNICWSRLKRDETGTRTNLP